MLLSFCKSAAVILCITEFATAQTSCVPAAAAAVSATGIAKASPPTATSTSIKWKKCSWGQDVSLECASISVPLDYTIQKSRLMSLPLVRIPASSKKPRQKSILYNPGGPGVSGILSLYQGAKAYQTILGDDFHLVSFDPRGVNNTIPFTCPTETAATDQSLPLQSARGMRGAFDSADLQADTCAAGWKLDGELVGTAFVARDMKQIINALGEDGMLRFIGFSYGTLLGATFASMFPNLVDRVVLDGNINPTDYMRGIGNEAISNTDDALLGFFEGCMAMPKNCAIARFGSSGKDLLAKFYEVLEQAKLGVIEDETGSTVSYNNIKGFMFKTLYQPSSWAEASQQLEAVFENSRATSSKVSRRDAMIFKRAEPDTDQALNAIACGDGPKLDATITDFGRFLDLYTNTSRFGGDQMIYNLYSCATWDLDAREKYQGDFKVTTRNPMLLVNSPFDPVTPLISAQNSSAGFKNSVLLQHNGYGHTSIAQLSTCTATAVRSYFNDGTMPAPGTICEPNNPLFSVARTSTSRPAAGKGSMRRSEEELLISALQHLEGLDHRPVRRQNIDLTTAVRARDILEDRATGNGNATACEAAPVFASAGMALHRAVDRGRVMMVLVTSFIVSLCLS